MLSKAVYCDDCRPPANFNSATDRVELCSRHAAVDELVEALERAVPEDQAKWRRGSDVGDWCYYCGSEWNWEVGRCINSDCAGIAARAVLDKVKEEEDVREQRETYDFVKKALKDYPA